MADLGVVTAPSGVLALATASHLSHVWPVAGEAFSERAQSAAAHGGGHVGEWLFEAVAVPVDAERPLAVRAAVSPSPFDQRPAIAVLEVDLGAGSRTAADAPLLLGDLPVDRCGMLLGDATALDSWVGLDGTSRDGLADVVYWGGHAQAARREFGGEPFGRWPGRFGWRDLPVAQARKLTDALRAWTGDDRGRGVMVSLDIHTDHYLASRAGWEHPLRVGNVTVNGCGVLLLEWDPGDHSMRHRGERAYGHVYPATINNHHARGAVLRWTIPPYDG
ncbi:hypothetical protein GCM10009662_29610 [Catellatospora coxensis]|uniref:Uncharacterized protein n=2 Tax=Catellatospora coxensis TaxID=310354 RepID=A0A8J3L973_9ACTN|nr:hypothetical protein Cco03nite_74760 [Catellatospora coxensis]